MEVSTRAKERFCKDCNIPIRLFQEPYFTDRLKLFDRFYGTMEKWNLFLEELQKYNCEQDYFEEYNCVKDAAILHIKNSEAYQRFNEEDMNKYRVTHENLPNKDIFKSTNDGRTFISIDMKKANFSSLHHYSEDMFQDTCGVANTWEEFISKFTDNKHIINSKYIRQVILGNCNPKRHITYEKYLMDEVLDFVTKYFISMDKVVFFSNDEIVFDMTDSDFNAKKVSQLQKTLEEKVMIPLKVEWFVLHKIYGTDGYYKEIFNENGEKEIEFKCLDNYMMPFVIRYFLGEEVKDSDKVFYHEGLLAQFMEVPKIEVNKSLDNMPMERIYSEFCKIVSSDSFSVQLLQYKDIFAQFIPELKDMFDFPQNNPYHAYGVFDHTIHAIKECDSKDLVVRLAVFFHDFGKPHSYQDGENGIRHFKGHGRVSADITDSIMKRLKFDDETRNHVVELVYYHDATFKAGKKYVRRWLNKIGEKQFRRLLEVRKADIKGQRPDYEQERIEQINKIEKILEEVLKEDERFSFKDLAVNGKDLINIGYKAGRELGVILQKLFCCVMEEEVSNNKEDLLELAKRWLLHDGEDM